MSTVLAELPGLRPYRNDLTFKPYVYRGAGVDLLTPELDSQPAERPAPGEPCWCGGDKRGYRKHLAGRTDPCQDSRDDVNLYTRTGRAVNRPTQAHLAGDGKPRCGGRGTKLAGSDAEVTCKTCLNLMNGTHGVGRILDDTAACGTNAAYRRHLRNDGKPVRCEECLSGERRRYAERTGA